MSFYYAIDAFCSEFQRYCDEILHEKETGIKPTFSGALRSKIWILQSPPLALRSDKNFSNHCCHCDFLNCFFIWHYRGKAFYLFIIFFPAEEKKQPTTIIDRSTGLLNRKYFKKFQPREQTFLRDIIRPSNSLSPHRYTKSMQFRPLPLFSTLIYSNENRLLFRYYFY